MSKCIVLLIMLGYSSHVDVPERYCVVRCAPYSRRKIEVS